MNLSKKNFADIDPVEAHRPDDVNLDVQPVDLPAGTQKDGEPDPIVVVFAADDNVAMPLGVTICSLTINFLHGNSDYSLVIYVLDMGLSEENRRKIKRCCQSTEDCSNRIKLSFIPINLQQLQPERFENDLYTPAVMAKLIVPQVIPGEHTKVIYLDADLLILGDISDLWEIDLEGFPLGACRDSETYYYDGFRTRQYILRQTYNTPLTYRLARQRKYFNAGVLVFNDIKSLSDENFSEQLLMLVAEKAGKFHDQDALNIYFEDRVKYLPLEWNFADMHTIDGQHRMTSDYLDTIHGRHPSIIHYAWRPKPWHGYKMRYGYETWTYYLSLTDWHSWRPPSELFPNIEGRLVSTVHTLLYFSRYSNILPEKVVDGLLYNIVRIATRMLGIGQSSRNVYKLNATHLRHIWLENFLRPTQTRNDLINK
ncbi:MAG: glycosyltransferase family 8 protein [Chloroflexota bacterium]